MKSHKRQFAAVMSVNLNHLKKETFTWLLSGPLKNRVIVKMGGAYLHCDKLDTDSLRKLAPPRELFDIIQKALTAETNIINFDIHGYVDDSLEKWEW